MLTLEDEIEAGIAKHEFGEKFDHFSAGAVTWLSIAGTLVAAGTTLLELLEPWQRAVFMLLPVLAVAIENHFPFGAYSQWHAVYATGYKRCRYLLRDKSCPPGEVADALNELRERMQSTRPARRSSTRNREWEVQVAVNDLLMK